MHRLKYIFCISFCFYFITGAVHSAQAAACSAENLRWAASSNSIYISGPVSCTLTQLDASISIHAPLELVDAANQIWFLGANLRLEQGATLVLHGTAIDGDVNELRLKSNNSPTDPNNFVFIRADWGTIDINSTKIISWNEQENNVGDVDTEYENLGRAFIHVRSRLDQDGVTPHESRLDIQNSEIAYLGYYAAESYGLTWKVSGYEPNRFDQVGVYGNVTDSYIHHNYFGIYTYGAEGMNLVNNEVAHNIQYGIDPHDDSDYLTIEDNHTHHNGNHGIICSQRCNNLTIRNNLSEYNQGNGIMLHRNANDSIVEENQATNNVDAGIAIFDSHQNTIQKNTATRNNKGIRLSVGSSGNIVENNDFSDNTQYGVFFYRGSDGRPKNNQFINNQINRNRHTAIKLKESDLNQFDSNSITNSRYGIWSEQSTQQNIQNNTFVQTDRAIYFNTGSDNNIITNNTIRDNGYAVYLYHANDNVFTQNTLTQNSRNYYYAREKAINQIVDTTEATVKIGDYFSQIAIINTENRAFQNNKNFSTTAYPDRTEIVFTRAMSGGVVTFNALDLFVTPANSSIRIDVRDWKETTNQQRRWSITPATAGVNGSHQIAGLDPNQNYQLWLDLQPQAIYSADADGAIEFNVNFDSATVHDLRLIKTL